MSKKVTDAIELLQAQLRSHIVWAADARTHPALGTPFSQERTHEYRFHLGYALALNQALVALGENFSDVEARITDEVILNRATYAQEGSK
jgi:hypothetical protein